MCLNSPPTPPAHAGQKTVSTNISSWYINQSKAFSWNMLQSKFKKRKHPNVLDFMAQTHTCKPIQTHALLLAALSHPLTKTICLLSDPMLASRPQWPGSRATFSSLACPVASVPGWRSRLSGIAQNPATERSRLCRKERVKRAVVLTAQLKCATTKNILLTVPLPHENVLFLMNNTLLFSSVLKKHPKAIVLLVFNQHVFSCFSFY